MLRGKVDKKIYKKRTEKRKKRHQRKYKTGKENDPSIKHTNFFSSPVLMRRKRRLQWPLSLYNLLCLLHTVREKIHVV